MKIWLFWFIVTFLACVMRTDTIFNLHHPVWRTYLMKALITIFLNFWNIKIFIMTFSCISFIAYLLTFVAHCNIFNCPFCCFFLNLDEKPHPDLLFIYFFSILYILLHLFVWNIMPIMDLCVLKTQSPTNFITCFISK